MSDQEHKNWVRYNCLEMATKAKPYREPQEQIEIAAKYARFCLGESECDVRALNKRGKQ